MEKREPSHTVSGMQTCIVTVENSIQCPQKIKNKTTLWPSNSTLGIYSRKKNKSINSKRYIHPNVHSSIFRIAKT